jgi:hypothetical protein
MLPDLLNGRRRRASLVPSVLEIADRGRAAALAFVAGTGTGWGHDDLRLWLAGPYRAAIASAAEIVPAVTVAPVGPGDEEGTLERVLLSTRERLLEILTRRDGWSESGFAPRAVLGQLVIPVRDKSGAVGYAPVDHPRLCLFDRIASLFFADYLTRPRDYEDLSLCEECGELSFAWAPAHRRHCEAPPSHSAVVPCEDRPALAPTAGGEGRR